MEEQVWRTVRAPGVRRAPDRQIHAVAQVAAGGGKLHYLRTKAGAEVDFIVARGGRLIPIEVKWTEHPTPGDARHLLTFLSEHPKRARHGYVICRCTAPLALTDRVTALPWFLL